MARRQLELSNEVAAELAGAQDVILKTLEEHLSADIFLRGNVVTLDGDGQNDPAFIPGAKAQAARRIPALQQAEYARGHAGIYDVSPDSRAILDRAQCDRRRMGERAGLGPAQVGSGRAARPRASAAGSGGRRSRPRRGTTRRGAC